MQDERDDQPEQDEGRETSAADAFDDLDDFEAGTAFRAWDLQVHAIDTIGDLYAKIAQIESVDASDVLRAIGHALVDIVEDHRPRNIAILASAAAVNRKVETGE